MPTSMLPALIMLYGCLVLLCITRFRRPMQTLGDFFLAGRRMGTLAIACSFVAAWFGAGSIIESLNRIHANGLAGTTEIMLPGLLSCLLVTLLFARRVAAYGSLSMPEAVERAYGRGGRLFLALVLWVSGVTFIGGEMLAAGRLLQSVLGWPLATAVWGAAAFVVAYSVAGGFLAVVITDMLQFSLFSSAVVALCLATLAWVNGTPNAWPLLTTHTPPSYWLWTQDFWGQASLIVTFVLAWSIAPEMWQRMSASQSPRQAQRSAILATACLALLYALVAITGLLSRGLAETGQPIAPPNVLLNLAQAMPWPLLGGFITAGVLVAITSTMDSTLNVGSLTLTHDLYGRFCRPDASQRELLFVSRLALAGISALAAGIALRFESILHILWISSDVLACTMFFPVALLLLLPKPSRTGGRWAMAAGGAMVLLSAASQYQWLGLPTGLGAGWPAWPYSTLLGVAASAAGYCLGWLLTQRQSADPG